MPGSKLSPPACLAQPNAGDQDSSHRTQSFLRLASVLGAALQSTQPAPSLMARWPGGPASRLARAVLPRAAPHVLQKNSLLPGQRAQTLYTRCKAHRLPDITPLMVAQQVRGARRDARLLSRSPVAGRGHDWHVRLRLRTRMLGVQGSETGCVMLVCDACLSRPQCPMLRVYSSGFREANAGRISCATVP
jgi:hypothetical protein